MLKINTCFISLLLFLSIAPAIYAQDNGSTQRNLTGIIETAAPSTNAQTGEIALNDVIISAYKSNITYAESASATVITQKDIEKGGYRFVSDVLQSVPGLQLVQSSTLGGTASVFIRGAKTGNMVVLIDGVKVNDVSTIERTFDFATLATDSIERIEIIKGPQSALYGSDATGGIINIVTKKGKGKPAVTLNMYAGSYYTTQLSTNVSGGDSSWNYSLTAGQISAQGYSKAAKPKTATTPFDDDGFYQRYAMGKCGFTPVAPLSIDAGFTVKKSAIEVDDSSYTDDPDSDEERTEVSGYTTIKHTIASFWEQSVTVNASRTQREYYDYNDGAWDWPADNTYTGSFYSAEWLQVFSLKNVDTLTVGVNYEKELSHIKDYLNDTSTNNDNSTTGFFAQNHINAGNILYLTASVRADNNEIFGWQKSYTVSPAIVIPKIKTKLKANYGRGYKAPGLYQIYGDGGSMVVENKDLKPEENTGYDIGIEQPLLSIATVNLTYFHNKYKDMIDYDSSSYPGRYININRVTTYGYESSVTITPLKALTLSGGYTYLKTEDETTDKPLMRRPEHQVYSSLTVTIAKFEICATGTYIGKRKDAYYDSATFSTVDVTLDGYFKADIAACYALTPQLTIHAKAENITDKKYQQICGYTMPQRSYYVGLTAMLQ